MLKRNDKNSQTNGMHIKFGKIGIFGFRDMRVDRHRDKETHCAPLTEKYKHSSRHLKGKIYIKLSLYLINNRS